MKKLLLLLVSLLLLFSLCACSGSNAPYTVEKGWRTLEIDPVACTITHKTDIIHYAIDKNDDGFFTVTITYPDGSTFYEKHGQTDSGREYTTRGHSDDYSIYKYVPGDVLMEALEDEFPYSLITYLTWWKVLIVGLGILGAVVPQIAWLLLIGWLLKDAEPGKYTLIIFRFLGIILLLIGLVLCVTP